MNWDRIEGRWGQSRGKAREQRGTLTDDDFDVVAGRRNQHAGKFRDRYAVVKEKAERQLASSERMASESWFTTDEDPCPGSGPGLAAALDGSR
jgi:uncharacterized protein YjbJ (UPF0337 family)